MSHNSSDEDEDDLKRAIALSLQESEAMSPSPKHPVVIDLISDDDEDDETDDLDPVIVPDRKSPNNLSYLDSGKISVKREFTFDSASLSSTGARPENMPDSLVIRSQPKSKSSETEHHNGQPAGKPTNGTKEDLSEPSGNKETAYTVSGLGSLDRRKMEEERLARVRKRKAPSSTPESYKSTDRQRSSTIECSDNSEPPLKKQVLQSILVPPEMSDESMKLKPVHIRDGENLMDKYSTKVSSLPARLKSLKTTPQFLIPSQLMSSEPAILADIESTVPGPDSSQKLLESNQSKIPETQSSNRQQAQMGRGIQYPHGTVKQTWAYGFPRGSDIKIEEVLQKHDLDLAVLSSFQWDDEWLLSKLDMKRTKLIIVARATNEQEPLTGQYPGNGVLFVLFETNVMQKEEITRNAPRNVRFCFPPMGGGAMHSKLQLLSHPSHLRVVVPSANLVPYDWGETGVMENTVFLIDLPRLKDSQVTTAENLTPFGRELRRFLNAMGMESKITDSLLKFDFSQTANLAFVHTIGGSHTGDDWKTTGYPGLGSAIQELGIANSNPLNLAVVSASIGALTDDFIVAMLLACKGDDGLTELTWRTSAPPKNRKSTPEKQVLLMEIEEGFRIFFPSHDTVQTSKGGTSCGGTICLQSKWYHRPGFPKELFLDCKSKRTGLLMHSKLFYITPTNMKTDGGLSKSWAYVGSANLSESAWGNLSKNKSTKQIKLNCRNWECGVVIPANKSFVGQTQNTSTSADILEGTTTQDVNLNLSSIFDRVAPLPMHFPSVEYGSGSPWFFQG